MHFLKKMGIKQHLNVRDPMANYYACRGGVKQLTKEKLVSLSSTISTLYVYSTHTLAHKVSSIPKV